MGIYSLDSLNKIIRGKGPILPAIYAYVFRLAIFLPPDFGLVDEIYFIFK